MAHEGESALGRVGAAGLGKGVAYAEVDGRDVIDVITPGFYLVALDAETGHPIP